MLIQLQDADKVWTLLAMVVAQKMIADGERNENVRKNSSTDSQVSEEGEGGGAPAWEETPLKPTKVYGGADIHLQPVKDPTPEAGGYSEEDVTLWEAHTGAGLVAPWKKEPTQKPDWWQDLWTHWETHAGAVNV